MDIQKEREAFESFFYENCLLAWEKDISETLFQKFESGDYEYVRVQSSWLSWQAAKAQAVPDLGELQERIAGHQYYHDEHGHMIVDMDDVVKEISGFDSWKAQAVPEWFVAKEIKPVENDSDEKVLTWDKVSGMRLVSVWSFKAVTDVTHWMPLPDAPQEPANADTNS